jgi:hypothetical protein
MFRPPIENDLLAPAGGDEKEERNSIVGQIVDGPALTVQPFERPQVIGGDGLELSFAEESARVHGNDAESVRHGAPGGGF